MQLRLATIEDAPMLARINVQGWAETYPGLLPEAEIACRTYDRRLAQWTSQIASQKSRIYVIPDIGFAQIGPQGSPHWAELGYSEELFALYLLRSAQGQGLGRALLDAARSAASCTVLVLDGNHRACRFYEKSGAELLKTYDDTVFNTVIKERVYGWPARP